MKDTILVNICADHTWECSTNVIARTGECGTAQFKILLTEEKMCNYSAYLEFKKPNGKKFKSIKLEITTNEIYYIIPKSLLTESGKLQVQLILEKETGEVWESNPKTYYILESISGAEEIPEIGITPIGTIDITTNGLHNVTTFAKANVNIKGEPYEFESEEQLNAFLNSSQCRLGTIVKCNNEYFEVVNDGEGTDKYYQKLSSGSTPTGEIEIKENGTYDVTNYGSAKVNISLPTENITALSEVLTPEEMESLLVAENLGKAYKYGGTTTNEYIYGDVYVVEEV